MTRHSKSAAYGVGALRSIPALETMRIGPVVMPISLFAWGLSLILHASVIGGALLWSRWSASSDTPPDILLARGEQAPQVRIMLVPWPPPEEVLREKPTETDRAPVTEEREDEQPVETAAVPPEEKPDAPFEPVETEKEPLPPLEEPPPPDVEAPREEPAESDVPERDDPTESEEPVQRQDEPAIEAPPAPAPEAPPESITPEEESAASPTQQIPENTPTGVETGVEILNVPTPRYPRLSRQRNEEGLVLLDIEVDADGTVGRITVAGDPGFPRLVNAAVEAARKARFQPATHNGKPVRRVIRIPFRFVLRQ